MRHATTVLMAGGGLAWTLGQAVLPDMGSEDDRRYDAVAEARDLESLSAGLLVVAAACLVLGALQLARRLPAMRTLSFGTQLLALGGLWLVGGRAAFNLTFYRLTDPQLDRDSAVAFLGSTTGAGFIPLLLLLPALLLGPMLLGVGVWRAGLAGPAALVLWVVGIGIFLATEFSLKVGEVVGIGVAAIALVVLGRVADAQAATGETTGEPDHATAGAVASRGELRAGG